MVAQVTVNGSPVSAGNPDEAGLYTLTIDDIAFDNAIDISTVPTVPTVQVHHVAVTAAVGVSIVLPSGESPYAVVAGNPFELRFALDAGYENPQVVVDGSAVAAIPDDNGYIVSFDAVTADITIALSASPVAATGISSIDPGDFVVSVIYYSLQGQEVRRPAITGIYIAKKTYASGKILVAKELVIVNN
jgi:hypothetical protein